MSHNTRGVEFTNPEARLVFDRQDAARFWAKVNKQGPVPLHRMDLGPCWQWTASVFGSRGYGQFRMQAPGAAGKQVTCYAHRIAWEVSHGRVPDGQWVLHHCDNPRCVNAAHLFLGNHKRNMEDASSKGRLNVPHPPRQKLTDAQIDEVRTLAATGVRGVRIAERFGVTKSFVSQILSGRKPHLNRRTTVIRERRSA